MESSAAAFFLGTSFFLLLAAPALSSQRTVVPWTMEGVQKINHTVTVSAGDRLTFMCPEGSFSTIWFMTKEDQYTNCECDSSCILLSNCAFFNANNYTSPIQRISENLENTPDYQPGNTYYFTSFSVNLKTLSNPSGNRSGGECVSEMLRLIVEVQSAEDSKPSPSPKPTFEATPTEATEATEAPEVGSAADSGDGKPIDPGVCLHTRT
jgi:hypothetical protein